MGRDKNADGDFYEWRQQAIESGLIYRATAQYYADDLSTHGYSFALNGERYDLPVFTSPEWRIPTSESFGITSIDEALPTNEDADALREFVGTAVVAQGEDPSTAEPSEYVWNGTLYATTGIDVSRRSFPVAPYSFYSAATTFSRLQDAMYRSLYEAGVDPIAKDVLSDDALRGTLRDSIAPSFEAFISNETPLPTGAGAVLFINTGEQYELVLSRRSPDALDMPGWLELIPAGFFEPDGEADETFVNRHIRREFAEELFGTTEDSKWDRTAESQALTDALATDGATIDHVLSDINPIKGMFATFSVLCIDDPRFYETYVGDDILGGWESTGVEFIPLYDADRIAEIVGDSQVKANHIPALVEALLWIEDQRDVTLPLELSR